ncbi:DNA mismatch repair endonuclease MutL [Thalassotalea ponticola]|uniref:DNA mismatch repair endonuclease MutL n=1 Tax=Thalassotalea ponticola TaxID=1523392 RepID=UPI0025B4EE05|nr:DNA mismatch repair endonuclease MutL [Thalassotalea ponticola]MDN3652875.1 DNA mismatch repair endonuclease MutL [Thalassotalea ponticola]
MAIQILPARLANQIAAGEVVERPASVVKELVENAIDAGASKIIVDIEKGGSKRIRITDNGHGIVKGELTLALSRHATSKIHSLDDLEAIDSLGFRGEALASISSVSRLTLTSKPVQQDAAWQASAHGRDMDVEVKPAAHPNGTTIDVEDLFFNTPARRKFLRTEKTEFAHIDEVIKRIALSKLELTLTVNHNGKTVRSYRSAKTDKQIEKRIAAICSQAFIDNAMAIEYQHAGMRLWGWIGSPSSARNQNDLAYSYVNGRMMRDKLINHAIRQAYGHLLSGDHYPAFVLYLELNHKDVDVNVHPAKHEVRFHQARLVHDFIVAAIDHTLQASDALLVDTQTGELIAQEANFSPSTDAGNQLATDNRESYIQPLRSQSSSSPRQTSGDFHSRGYGYKQGISEQAVNNYNKLMSISDDVNIANPTDSEPSPSHSLTQGVGGDSAIERTSNIDVSTSVDSDVSLFRLIDGHVVLLECRDTLYCCNFKPLRQQLFHWQLSSQYPQGLVSQRLLLPVAVKLDSEQRQFIEQHIQEFEFIGIQLAVSAGKVVIKQYPAQMREQDISESFIALLNHLRQHNAEKTEHWLGAVAEIKCRQGFELAMVEKLIASATQLENFDLFTYIRLNSKVIDLTSEAQQLQS